MLTALDQVANRNHLQIIKAFIPYIQPCNQKNISIFIKIMELQNIMRYYNVSPPGITACQTESISPDILDILSDIKKYCDEKEQSIIDQIIQTITTIELFSMFSNQEDVATGIIN